MPDETKTDLVIETKEYADGSSATGVAPLPDLSPEEQEAQVKLTGEERVDALCHFLRDTHGIHVPDEIAPKA